MYSGSDPIPPGDRHPANDGGTEHAVSGRLIPGKDADFILADTGIYRNLPEGGLIYRKAQRIGCG